MCSWFARDLVPHAWHRVLPFRRCVPRARPEASCWRTSEAHPSMLRNAHAIRSLEIFSGYLGPSRAVPGADVSSRRARSRKRGKTTLPGVRSIAISQNPGHPPPRFPSGRPRSDAEPIGQRTKRAGRAAHIGEGSSAPASKGARSTQAGSCGTCRADVQNVPHDFYCLFWNVPIPYRVFWNTQREGKMLVGYARTSTTDQAAGLADQQAKLKAAGADRVYVEQASAGNGKARPELDALLAFLRRDDVLCRHAARPACTLDARPAGHRAAPRGRRHCAPRARHGRDRGRHPFPTGKLLFTVLGAIGTFERDLMLDRQRVGIAAAKAGGKFSWPPAHRPPPGR